MRMRARKLTSSSHGCVGAGSFAGTDVSPTSFACKPDHRLHNVAALPSTCLPLTLPRCVVVRRTTSRPAPHDRCRGPALSLPAPQGASLTKRVHSQLHAVRQYGKLYCWPHLPADGCAYCDVVLCRTGICDIANAAMMRWISQSAMIMAVRVLGGKGGHGRTAWLVDRDEGGGGRGDARARLRVLTAYSSLRVRRKGTRIVVSRSAFGSLCFGCVIRVAPCSIVRCDCATGCLVPVNDAQENDQNRIRVL